jgi:hypothetical protein
MWKCPFTRSTARIMPFASGVTDAEGNYTLQAFVGKGTAGAVVGENRVSFSMSKNRATKKIPTGDRRGGERERKGEMVVPDKYLAAQITFTVPPGGTTEANFDLSSH